MRPKTEFAYFLIADISGYTSFFNGAELDHAQDIVAAMMETVLRRLRPPFRLAKFEGDAAFVYGVAEKVDGSLLEEAIESAYFAFRRRLRDIKFASSCECGACRTMERLDLKFVSHYGEFIKHRMAGREELAGRDVILVHRLLKNLVKERLGEHAYALYSDPCIQAMGIDPIAKGLAEHREGIEVLGEVRCWVRDLDAAWTKESRRRRSEVTCDRAARVFEFAIAAPRQTVWDHFILPDHRPKWHGANAATVVSRRGGRGGGAIIHCMHGDHVVVEEVIDWHPLDYATLAVLSPVTGAPTVTITYAFFGIEDGGTRVEIRVAKPKRKDSRFSQQVAQFQDRITSEVAALRLILDREKAAAAVVGNERRRVDERSTSNTATQKDL